MSDRTLYVVADSHLGVKEGDVELMIQFIVSLNPSTTELLFLGDLFHIWAEPKKFHTLSVGKLMAALQRYQEQNGISYLITGNRDVFFKDYPGERFKSFFPFQSIATDSLTLDKPDGMVYAVHGDTINTKDEKYLKWRRTIRHPLFQLPFRLIPSFLAKKIMFSLEAKLKQTNLEFRHSFPHEEWQTFIKTIHHQSAPKLILAGHFHPMEPVVEIFNTTTGIVLPDWCDHYFYLKVDPQLHYKFGTFNPDQTI